MRKIMVVGVMVAGLAVLGLSTLVSAAPVREGGPQQQAAVAPAARPGSSSVVKYVFSGAIAAVGVGLSLGLTKSFIPAPQDEGMRLEAAITKTANFDGTAYDQGLGFAPGGVGMCCAAVVNVTAADRANSDETYTFVLEESADGNTWSACGPAVAIDVAADKATLGAISVPGFCSKRYCRVKLTVAGTTPSITYEAWLNCNVCSGSCC